MQIVILKDTDSNHAILKHLTCPEKVKPNMVRSLVYGTPYRAKWMTKNPKVGRKVLQYCLEGLGGRQLKCFELSSAATRKPAKAGAFEDKDDDEIDAGFDYILKYGPRSASENAQLRWQTKNTRKVDSPIYGWPTALVDKALRIHGRCLGPEGIQLAYPPDHSVLPPLVDEDLGGDVGF